MKIAKYVVAVIAGFILGGIVVAMIQQISVSMFPYPENFDFNDKEAFKAFLDGISNKPVAFGLVALSHALGAFAAGFIATKIASSANAGWVAAGILVVMTIYNSFLVPTPLYFEVIDVVLAALFGYFGVRLASK